MECHNETCNYFMRNIFDQDPAFARSKLRNMAYFIYVRENFNKISRIINISNFFVPSFKVKCKSYFLNCQ